MSDFAEASENGGDDTLPRDKLTHEVRMVSKPASLADDPFLSRPRHNTHRRAATTAGGPVS
jgi:hypothetical protein